MKKSELIAAIMSNEKKTSLKQDPWVTKIFDEMQEGLYSGMPVVLYGDRVGRQMQRLQMEQLFNSRKASKDDDKKIADCRAKLNQLDPFKYTWALEQYLSVGSTARASSVGIFSHVDAGKTTASERIRKLSGDIHNVDEAHEDESTPPDCTEDHTRST